ncbi:MAG: HAD family phosphatase [Terracidiphilus sp.]
MALRAVVFDYGMVLTDGQNAEAHAELMRLTGLEHEQFEALYWVRRHEYDLGLLTGLAFWHDFLLRAGIAENPALAEELNAVDARMWTSANPEMLAWQLALKARGLKTAILSNMGDNVLARMERTFDWLSCFDVLVWSFQLRLAKPDPAIYQYTLEQLGVEAGETLFLDDRESNVEAAQALGIRALQFSTVDRLRQEILSTGLAAELPLP